jgi:mannose-1-phosphate guanylyltransferase
MQIDYALILAAGKGSRMGEIGKKLPKPLWPVFYKSLLELQVDYCNDLGIQRIFINTHFLSKEIEDYLKSDKKFEKVVVLHEEPLLDSGGAIHNMASRGDVNYTGNVLTVNADQFLFFDADFFSKALYALEKNRASLFGIKVEKSSKYNETIVKDGLLTEITKASGAYDYITYSGLGLIKLDGLRPAAGITKFFETVANFQKEKISFITPDEFEYWDFGTAEIYMDSIKKIFENRQTSKDSVAMGFFKSHGTFNGNEDNFYSSELSSISLEGVSAFEKNSIVGLGIIQNV